jgi:hypothetical protein
MVSAPVRPRALILNLAKLTTLYLLDLLEETHPLKRRHGGGANRLRAEDAELSDQRQKASWLPSRSPAAAECAVQLHQ